MLKTALALSMFAALIAGQANAAPMQYYQTKPVVVPPNPCTAACGGIRSVPHLGDTVTLNPQPLPPRYLSGGGATLRR
jgi:hypothetical protein